MGGKKYSGRNSRAKHMAATAAVVLPPASVQELPAPTHTFYAPHTQATLTDKLARTIEGFEEEIRREIVLWVATEFGSDNVALVAAGKRGDPKAQLATVIMPEKHNDAEVLKLAYTQKNPGVELWFGMKGLRYIISQSDASDPARTMRMLHDNKVVISQADASDPDRTTRMLRDHKVGKVLIAHLTASAESGSTYAQKARYILGMVMYQSACASGDRTDFFDAARWIRKAAKQGDLEAQYELGKMFLHRLFCNVRMHFARKYIGRASKQGHVEATACMK
eukprot:CAMPEP_0198702348 /NCGR_PEP_ID=MMETSP1468-20131203/388713_1 /TAXON_ID=1461545 /ORGANISM="Mantoniella sp, Strain CCMP1436" /LENGTH=278 /DNA_ID=CAMNT_0044460871 /DNA_START=1740 /DNA_END=2573 /DNA_ORIENTATION=+